MPGFLNTAITNLPALLVAGLDTNAFQGKGPHFVIEADESDGSIVKYTPYISVVTNISHDHKTVNELEDLFLSYR